MIVSSFLGKAVRFAERGFLRGGELHGVYSLRKKCGILSYPVLNMMNGKFPGLEIALVVTGKTNMAALRPVKFPLPCLFIS